MPQQARPARPRTSAVRRSVALSTAIFTGLFLSVFPSAPSRADTVPVPPQTVPTVSADALPTVQINGVVWAQVVVGSRVYATGSFTKARPAGAAAGVNETARSNILAYDIATGNLITSWAPSLNGQGLALAASADGTRIYVGGDFTWVSGVARSRIVALDATTGAVVSGFNASTNGRVRALAVSGTTLYAGGNFTTAGGQARQRLAAFNGSTGALLGWAPTADQQVWGLVAPAGSGKIVASGSFVRLNGATAIGMGALNATTGANLPWPVNTIIKNYGADAAIYSLSTDGTQVYGTGYSYLINGTNGTNANLENTFAAKVSDGTLVWVSGCLGDTYSSVPLSGVLYNVGHAHNCQAIGSFPEQNPRVSQRALAYTTTPAANGAVNTGGAFAGRPAPQWLTWTPTIAAGTYTGQAQGAWSVAGNSQYLVMGGEFPKVNGVAQQGLTRFAIRSLAPNKQGPQDYATLIPALTRIAPGAVRVSWKSSWDRDNRRLTYQVLRGATPGTSTVLSTQTLDTEWWNRPTMTFTDTTAPVGSTQTYRIRVKDPLGNTQVSAAQTITAALAFATADAAGSDR